MKIFFNYFKYIVYSAAILAATYSCDTTAEEIVPEVAKTDLLTLSASGSSIKNIVINVEYADDAEEYPYAVVIVEENKFDASNKEEAVELIKDLLPREIDPEEVDNRYIFASDAEVDIAAAWELEWNTDYIVAAVAFDNEEAVSDVATVKFRTGDESEYGLKSITITETTHCSVAAEIDAGGYEGIYLVAAYPKAIFDRPVPEEQGDPEGYNSDADYIAAVFAYTYTYLEHPLDEVNEDKLVFSGDATAHIENFWNVEPNMEYVAFAFGVLPDGSVDGKVLMSEPYTTPKSPDTTIDIEVSNINDTSAEVTFSPSIDGVAFYSDIIRKKDLGDKTNEDLINANPYFIYYLAKEAIAYDPEKMELTPGTEYVAIAFECTVSGNISEKRFTKEFTTTGEAPFELEFPESITIPDVEFGTLTVNDITSTSISVDVAVNDEDMRYIIFAAAFDYVSGFSTYESLIMDDLLYIKDYADLYGWPFLDGVTYYSTSGSAVGEDAVVFDGLDSGAETVVYAYGIDLKTAQPLTELCLVKFETLAAAPTAVAQAPNFVESTLRRSCRTAMPKHEVEATKAAIKRDFSDNKISHPMSLKLAAVK